MKSQTAIWLVYAYKEHIRRRYYDVNPACFNCATGFIILLVSGVNS